MRAESDSAALRPACAGVSLLGGVVEVCGPAFFDVGVVPDGECDCPGGDEDADDDEAEEVDVDVFECVPERAGEVEFGRDQAAESDRADDQRDGDG